MFVCVFSCVHGVTLCARGWRWALASLCVCVCVCVCVHACVCVPPQPDPAQRPTCAQLLSNPLFRSPDSLDKQYYQTLSSVYREQLLLLGRCGGAITPRCVCVWCVRERE
ncbi:MAG: hypothetical protein P4L40_22740 [Terracidiphilus sp.]|nr:hypothetical protein [Terracidiphilus sp.]